MEKKKQHYIIVHAGINFNCLTEAETIRKNAFTSYNKKGELINLRGRGNRKDILWSRKLSEYGYLRRSVVVHGHTVTIDEDAIECGAVPGKVHFGINSINVDCGMVFLERQSNLAAIRLEDLEEFYVYKDDSRKYANYEVNQQKKADLLQSRRVINAKLRERERLQMKKVQEEIEKLEAFFEDEKKD